MRTEVCYETELGHYERGESGNNKIQAHNLAQIYIHVEHPIFASISVNPDLSSKNNWLEGWK